MCITSEPSRMSKTIVSCTRAVHPVTGRAIHVNGYQNCAESTGPNCMILPFPAGVRMSRENILDTSSMKSVLKDYQKSVSNLFLTKGCDPVGTAREIVDVFAHGSYQVLLTDDARLIETALQQMPDPVRPSIQKSLVDFLADLYPAGLWTLALCCWEGQMDAEPLLWWYEPRTPSLLFFPGMDAHSGGPPEDKYVSRDHTLAHNWGRSYEKVPVMFSEKIDEPLRPFLATYVGGIQDQGLSPNGDWFLDATNGAWMVRGLDQVNDTAWRPKIYLPD